MTVKKAAFGRIIHHFKLIFFTGEYTEQQDGQGKYY
jgi:hypothetical protein